MNLLDAIDSFLAFASILVIAGLLFIWFGPF
jgi:hypothetical protein